MDFSKSKIKREFDSTSPVFSEVDMSTVKSQVWKHFLRDKKRGLAIISNKELSSQIFPN